MIRLAHGRRWSSLVLALSFCLAIFGGAQPGHAQGQDDYFIPDLGPVDKELQDLVDAARSIVGRAKECIAVADVAGTKAGSAFAHKVRAEDYSKDAMVFSDETVRLATLVSVVRVVAENESEAARTAADAAADALEELEKEPQFVVVAGVALDSQQIFVPAETQDVINKELDKAKMYANMASQAAMDADAAAKAAETAARTAEVAAADAADAGRVAADAVDMALEDADAAVMAARSAADAARSAAASARGAGELNIITDDAAKYLVETVKQAQMATEHADAAKNALKMAPLDTAPLPDGQDGYLDYLVGEVGKNGENAGGNASSSGREAGVARTAAGEARMYADEANDCAEEVAARESTLSALRAASAYLSRTITNRVQKLRPAGGSSFQRPARLARGKTGLNAGDVTRPTYPSNLAMDVGYSSSRGGDDLFKARSLYVLVMTDTLLTRQRLVGAGVGTEYTRQSLLGSSVRRTRGLTATVYAAEILNETFTLLPQAALTHLRKKTTKTTATSTGEGDEGNAMRTLCSLTLLAQKQWSGLEMSGFGQFAYTYETAFGSAGGDAAYLGQAITGGEFALPVTTSIRLFMGASLAYDVTRSKSNSDRLGYEGNLGVRSPLGSQAEFSLSVTASGNDEETTTGGNVFVKVFF